MYTKKGKCYSDAGKYLVSGVTVGFELPAELEDISEVAVDLTDMEIRVASGMSVAVCSAERCSFLVRTSENEPVDYARLKREIVKMRYSNDDQIAIILNRDEGDEQDSLDYDHMQEWRDWASEVAHTIIDCMADK